MDNTTNIILDTQEEMPLLADWKPTDDQIYFHFESDVVIARYDKLGLKEDNKLSYFVIKKNHYKERLDDICNVINYFLSYFDTDLKSFKAIMGIKFIIDQKPTLNIKAFQKMVLDQVITEEFVNEIKKMSKYLYRINIDSDSEGRYKNTPKISNDEARSIVAVTFAIRCVLPLCIHFADTNSNFLSKKDYIPCFDKIIMKIIRKFEKDDIKIFTPLCRIVSHRVSRSWSSDIGICLKKKQLYGMTEELYLEEIIHEVILVKSLYKLDYNRSVVSFIDGVIFLYHYNFKIENFKFKPIEIDPQEQTDDDDNKLSHQEEIEMKNYHLDESNVIISEVNTAKVLKDIDKKFNIDVPEEEINFYLKNMRITPVTKLFLESFYYKYFHDSNATLSTDLDTTIKLIIYMKKYLQLRGLTLIPQLITAKVKGKYKENTIKNTKFVTKVKTSNVWNTIVDKKYTYIKDISKEDLLIKKISSFVNSQFEFVDYDSPIHGIVYEDIDQDKIIDEFSLFLTII